MDPNLRSASPTFSPQAADPTKRVKLVITRFNVGLDATLTINLDGTEFHGSGIRVVRKPLTQTTFISTGSVLRMLYTGSSLAYAFTYSMVD